MSEVIDRTQENIQRKTSFDMAIATLAEEMKILDAHGPQVSADRQRILELERELSAVDLDMSIELQPKQLANKALEHLMLTRRMAEISRPSMEQRYFGLFINRMVLVEPILESSELGLFDGSVHTGGTYRRSTPRVKKGKIKEMVLDAEYGGFIKFRRESNSYYQASPLIDRKQDYQPAFKVTFL